MATDPRERSPGPIPTRTERRKLEVRNRILAAAAGLFDQRGVQATTVEAICEDADVARRTFFNHFPAKQDVVRALAGEAIRYFAGQVELARKQGPATRDRVAWLFDTIAENTAAAGPMHRELLSEIIHAGHEPRPNSGGPADAESARILHEAFEGLIRDGVAAGDVTTRHSPEILTDVLLGTFYALMLNWTNLDGYPLREQLPAAARFLNDALAREPEENDR